MLNIYKPFLILILIPVFQIGLSAFVSGTCIEGSVTTENPVNKEKQIQWIKNAIESFKNSDMGSDFVEVNFKTHKYESFEKTWIRLSNNSVLKLSDTESAYFLMHSTHQDSETGDITLMISSDKIYLNRGHICGDLITFFKSDIKIPVSVSEFISDFISETDDLHWEIVDISN